MSGKAAAMGRDNVIRAYGVVVGVRRDGRVATLALYSPRDEPLGIEVPIWIRDYATFPRPGDRFDVEIRQRDEGRGEPA